MESHEIHADLLLLCIISIEHVVHFHVNALFDVDLLCYSTRCIRSKTQDTSLEECSKQQHSSNVTD